MDAGHGRMRRLQGGSQAGTEVGEKKQELCGASSQVGAEPELQDCPGGEGLGSAAPRSLAEAWEEHSDILGQQVAD